MKSSKPCPYSPSCFTCTLKDCQVSEKGNITKINRLPADLLIHKRPKKITKTRAALAAVPSYSVEPRVYREVAAAERMQNYGPLDY
jgi:hypothetical protein